MASVSIRIRATGPPGATAATLFKGDPEDAGTVGEFDPDPTVAAVDGSDTLYWVTGTYDDVTGTRPAGDWVVGIGGWDTGVHIIAGENRYLSPVPELEAAEIAEAVDTQLSSSHGAGSWEGGVGAGGGGPLPLTITLEDSDGDPLTGFIVYLLDSETEEPLNKWLVTDDDGECQFNLAADTYIIAVMTRTGYVTPANVTKVLASPGGTETIVIASQTTDPPSDAILCVIDDYIYDGSKEPVVGATVSAVANELAKLSGAGVITAEKTKATTDSDGRFTLALVRADAMSAGSNYTIEIRHQAKNIYRTITAPIPNAASATLNEVEAGAS